MTHQPTLSCPFSTTSNTSWTSHINHPQRGGKQTLMIQRKIPHNPTNSGVRCSCFHLCVYRLVFNGDRFFQRYIVHVLHRQIVFRTIVFGSCNTSCALLARTICVLMRVGCYFFVGIYNPFASRTVSGNIGKHSLSFCCCGFFYVHFIVNKTVWYGAI